MTTTMVRGARMHACTSAVARACRRSRVCLLAPSMLTTCYRGLQACMQASALDSLSACGVACTIASLRQRQVFKLALVLTHKQSAQPAQSAINRRVGDSCRHWLAACLMTCKAVSGQTRQS